MSDSNSPTEPPRFSQHFWGDRDNGFQVLMDKMKSSKHILVELLSIFQTRLEAEEEYARRMIKVSRFTNLSKDEGSIKQVLESFKFECETVSKNRVALAEELRMKLVKPLDQFIQQQREGRKIHQQQVEKSLKLKQACLVTVAKTEEKYRSKCIELDNLSMNRVSSSSAASAASPSRKDEPKVQKAAAAAKAADQEYQGAVDKLRDAHTAWVKDMYAACEEFQKFEEMRIDYIRNSLFTYANSCSSVCVIDDESYERIRKALETCDIQADIRTFIGTHGTGSAIPPPVEYKNYYNNEAAKLSQPGFNPAFSPQGTPTSPPANSIQATGAAIITTNLSASSRQSTYNPFNDDEIGIPPPPTPIITTVATTLEPQLLPVVETRAVEKPVIENNPFSRLFTPPAPLESVQNDKQDSKSSFEQHHLKFSPPISMSMNIDPNIKFQSSSPISPLPTVPLGEESDVSSSILIPEFGGGPTSELAIIEEPKLPDARETQSDVTYFEAPRSQVPDSSRFSAPVSEPMPVVPSPVQPQLRVDPQQLHKPLPPLQLSPAAHQPQHPQHLQSPPIQQQQQYHTSPVQQQQQFQPRPRPPQQYQRPPPQQYQIRPSQQPFDTRPKPTNQQPRPPQVQHRPPPQQQVQQFEKPFKVRVLYNYDASQDDELSLDQGQVLTVQSSPEPGWFYGELQIGSKKSYGLFPANIVERVQ